MKHSVMRLFRRDLARPWAPIPLRLILGVGFVYHGAPKLFSSEGHEGFAALLRRIAVPAPEVTSWVVGGVELVGGIALLLGAWVVLWSALLTVEMLVAMFTVHWPHGFNFINVVESTPDGPVFGMPGYEVNLLYMAGLVSLALMGAGRLALDREPPQEQEVVLEVVGIASVPAEPLQETPAEPLEEARR